MKTNLGRSFWSDLRSREPRGKREEPLLKFPDFYFGEKVNERSGIRFVSVLAVTIEHFYAPKDIHSIRLSTYEAAYVLSML